MTEVESENPSFAIEAFENIKSDMNKDLEIDLFDLKARLMKIDDFNREKAESCVKRLLEEDFILLEDSGEDTIRELRLGEIKEYVDYEERFRKSSNLDDNNLIIREFAEWLCRDAKLVKTVKLGPEKESKEIWSYDKDEQTWNKEGENLVSEKLYNELPSIHSSHYEDEAINKVKKIDPINIEDAGPDKGRVVVANGVLDLNSDKIRNIERNDYILNKLPVKYQKDAGEPEIFLEFLEDVVNSQKDIEKIQEFLGYCLMTQTAKYEKSLMILGPTDSGKSVFLNVVRSLLGKENVAQESLQNLTNGRQWGLANIVDKIANIDHDLDAEKLNDIGTAKKVISGNPMSIEEKYKQPYEYAPTAKHLFSANKTPPRDKEDDAFYNRWLTVTFPQTVPPEDQDPNLIDKLTEKEELQRILNWAVEGNQRLEETQGFTGEKGPEETKMIWRQWGNSIDRFIAKFLETRPQLKKKEENSEEDIEEMTLKTHTGTIYELYEKYASGMDMEVKGKNALSSEIKKLPGVKSGQPTIRGNTQRGYKGVKIVENCYQRIDDEIEDYQGRKY